MSQSHAVPVKTVGRAYVVECLFTMGLYTALMIARHWLILHAANHLLAWAAMISPVFPAWAMLFVVWRFYRRIDEFQKQKFLESTSIAFGVSACLLVTYSLVSGPGTGLPPLSIIWAWPVLGVTWWLTATITNRPQR